jgi:predicted amidophosphoribosyltransferase
LGKIIDAEFGGRNAHDRYCSSCRERYPRASTLCPRCGGALVLWATHVASAERRAQRGKIASAFATAGLVLAIALVVAWLLITGA